MLNLLLAINKSDLLKSLDIMWKGVLAIFVVIALVIVTTTLVNKACVAAEKKAEEKKDADNDGQNRQQ